MKIIKTTLAAFFVLISLWSFSQDLIVKRDSSVIFCKISKIDSSTIYYRQKKGEQTMELSISRADIVSFYKKNAALVNEIPKVDTVKTKKDTTQIKVVAIVPKTDSLQTITTILQQQKDSLQAQINLLRKQMDTTKVKAMGLLPKQDTTKAKITFIKPQGDSIFLNVNYKCFHKGELITRKEALDLMKSETAAHKEMKKARAYFAPVIPLGVGAVVLAGVFIYDAVSTGDFHWWVVGSGSIVLSVVAITLKHSFNIHAINAVKIFNTHNKLGIASIPKYELGVASKGIGISFKF